MTKVLLIDGTMLRVALNSAGALEVSTKRGVTVIIDNIADLDALFGIVMDAHTAHEADQHEAEQEEAEL